jgi:hypothetical protein
MIQKIEKTPFFFIIGRPRSGTTLLKELFDAHANIIIPIEFPVILELSYKYGNRTVWSKYDLQEFYDDLYKVRFVDLDTRISYLEMNKVDTEKLHEDLMKCEGTTSYSTLIKVLYLNTKSIFPKEKVLLIGDKNPVYSMYPKEVLRLFPDARIIHIIRDHRDHTLSVIRTKLYKFPSVALISYQWKRSLRMIRKQKEKFPEKFYTIRYEDLTKDPGHYVKEICEFLNVNFDENVLNFHKITREKYTDFILYDELVRHQDNIFNPVNTKMVNKWKNEMDRKSQMIADFTVGRYAEKYGYERQFKSQFSRYAFPVYLMKSYVQFQYMLRFIINPMPLKAKYSIKKRDSIFMIIYQFLFGNV